ADSENKRFSGHPNRKRPELEKPSWCKESEKSDRQCETLTGRLSKERKYYPEEAIPKRMKVFI
uniref:Prolactin receptor n=1 Tax=Romanomermis culicivorax TaxID=13658 RepID=A0A915KIG6_ROMCU